MPALERVPGLTASEKHMADNRKTLERFIRQQVFRTRENALERFILRSGIGRGNEVDTISVPPDVNSDNILLFVDEILSRAQSDADSLGSKTQRYTLIAAELGQKDGARFNFRVKGEGDDEDDDGGGEPATEKGIITQQMRHNEALMRMLVQATGTMVNGMARRLDAAEKQTEMLITQRHEHLRVLEDAKTQQHERDVQMLLTSGQEERKNALLKRAETLFPLVLNKLSGKPLIPEGPEANVMRALANSLTPDQLQAMAPLLTTEQQILLMTILKAMREEPPKPNGVTS